MKPGPKAAPVRERLLARLVADAETGCLLWTGFINTYGYGRICINDRGVMVHRVMYELMVGPIPAGLVIDHLCRTRHCANPAHLEAVTNAENIRRGEPANRTHCPQGHAYDELNTRWKDGKRNCKACDRQWHRARRKAVAA